MDICRLFHKKSKKRKEQKILLITQSFPQSPQVFPQGFSTGGACCGYAVLVHIKRSDTLRRISHFSAGRGFYHEHFFVQKLGPDNSPRRPRRPPTGAGWPGRSFLRPERQKILKKGLTKRGFCYILNKSSAMSHQKRQQLNKMESWLSGRRRTIGNRVGVMSVSRVQIPNSPP